LIRAIAPKHRAAPWRLQVDGKFSIVRRMARQTRSTLAEQAYQELREQIVRGDLPAGHRLLPEKLGQALSISPTPVKEALAMLQRDGLIEVAARRGTAVRRFTPRDIGELYDVRGMVESYAITTGLAAGRVTDAFLDRLERCVTLHAERSQRRSRVDLRHALRHDHDFHTLLVELAGNALLADWHQRLLRQTHLARAYSLRAFDAGRLARARGEHAAILAALRARAAPATLRALAAHLNTSRTNVLADHK
jgi:DNA-binding GntR family transcriptional regulator